MPYRLIGRDGFLWGDSYNTIMIELGGSSMLPFGFLSHGSSASPFGDISGAEVGCFPWSIYPHGVPPSGGVARSARHCIVSVYTRGICARIRCRSWF